MGCSAGVRPRRQLPVNTQRPPGGRTPEGRQERDLAPNGCPRPGLCSLVRGLPYIPLLHWTRGNRALVTGMELSTPSDTFKYYGEHTRRPRRLASCDRPSLAPQTSYLASLTVRGLGRGRPLVQCSGPAGPSRAPSASLRDARCAPLTARRVPGAGWLSGGPSAVAPGP